MSTSTEPSSENGPGAVEEDATAASPISPGPVEDDAKWTRRMEERFARWFTRTRLPVLARHREEAARAVRQLPKRLQRLTNQTSLVLELVEDFRTGHYRQVSWGSIAVATGALLYCVSPADAIPDFIPVVGVMDEALVLAVATRLIRGDLIRYAEFKGYDRDAYFAS